MHGIRNIGVGVAMAVALGAVATGCGEMRGEGRGLGAGGISSSFRASETTLEGSGIAQWHVIPDESMVEFVGVDVGDEMVVDIIVRSTPDALTLEMSGAVEGVMVITPDGHVLENTIEDPTLLRYIHADGGAALELVGFRDATMGDCAAAAAGAGLDCGAAVAKKWDGLQWGKCGVSGVGAGWTCYDWWNTPGEGEGEPQDPPSEPQDDSGTEPDGQPDDSDPADDGSQDDGTQWPDDGGGDDGDAPLPDDGGNADDGDAPWPDDGGGDDGTWPDDGGEDDGTWPDDGGGDDGSIPDDGGGDDGWGDFPCC
jgi:hypothetical protein